MQIKKKGQEGFTLIELLVVVVIIGILSSVAVPNFMGAQDKAKNSGVQSNGHTVQMALEQYAVDSAGQYPASLTAAEGGQTVVVGAASTYLTAFPKTPWNHVQTANIAAAAADLTKKVNDKLADAGKAQVPAAMSDYGAVGYKRDGTADEMYDLIASGKKGNTAILVFKAKNY